MSRRASRLRPAPAEAAAELGGRASPVRDAPRRERLLDLLLDPRPEAGERGDLKLAHACQGLVRQLDLPPRDAHDGVCARRDGGRNRQVGAQARALEPEQALGIFDVLQAVLAGVLQREAVEVAADERPRRLRDEHLPAAGQRADPRSADDVEAEIALVAERRLAGVDAHPHEHLGIVRPVVRRELALNRRRGGERVPRPREDGEEGVTLAVDLAPARSANARRMISLCAATTSPHRSPRRWRSRVEPSMSEKRKVTVPLGNSATGAP